MSDSTTSTSAGAHSSRRAEAAADAELTRRFRLLIESVEDYAIFILDPEGHVQTWNPGAQRIKGYSEQEIVGKHFSVFYPPETNAQDKLEVARQNGHFEGEGWRLRKDGTRFWAKVTITALRDGDGQLIGFAKVTQDLTARRNAEEEAQRYRLLVDSVKDYAIFMLDPNGQITTWNAGAQRIKGYASSEIIGLHFSVFYPPEERAEGKAELELEIATREGRFEEEGWRLRKDGSRFWANVVLTALRDPEGALVGFAKVTRDLTLRREAEIASRELAEQNARLAEKARIHEFQERFLGVLGHDLRNPLASIEMATSMLQTRVGDADWGRVLTRMRSSVDRMTRMIGQILDLTRSRLASGIQLAPRPIDLHDTLTKIVDELSIAHPTRTFELVATRLPMTADPDRMEQVFSNLIGNAVAYGEPAKAVSIQALVSSAVVTVAVHNEGNPIPREILPKLFDPFRRGERESRSEQTAGLGLGLYISQEIIQAHGGSIEVESSAHTGTTFSVRLPLNTPGQT